MRFAGCWLLLGVAACQGGFAIHQDAGGSGQDGRSSTDGGPRPSCGTVENQEGCGCVKVGESRACYGGPPDTRGLGLCHDGIQTCQQGPSGIEIFLGVWGPCMGDVRPSGEICTDGQDHDCNGSAGCSDPGCATEAKCAKVCQPGQTKPCYTGPAGTSGKGACKPGVQTCDANGQWAAACNGEVVPVGEFGLCHDNIDNDCNGVTDCQDFGCLIDLGCLFQQCEPGKTQACYDGPAGTEGIASCQGGTKTCAADGRSWGPCSGQVLPSPEGGHCADGLDNDCSGLADCNDPVCSTAPNCCKPPGPPVDGTIYAHSPEELYTVDPNSWTVTKVGSFANGGDQITDIAVTPDGKLYGISFTSLYSINKSSGQASLIASVPGSASNALTFLADGNLLASDSSGDLKRIDPMTGAVSSIGNFGNALSSSGDLVAVDDGTMYGVSSTTAGGGDASDNNVLMRIDTSSGKATVVGPIGFGSVWGLAYVKAQVIGFTTTGQIIRIDPQTGAGTLLATRAVAFWGAGMSPLVQANPCP